MKVNTLNPANVLCPSLLTTRYNPNWLYPGGGIGISGNLTPEVTVNEGLEIVDILATLRWKNNAGVALTSLNEYINFSQVGSQVAFSAQFQGLPQFNEVLTLHVELLIKLRTPQAQITYSSNGYSTGIQWAVPPIPASINCQFMNQDVNEEYAFIVADYVGSAAWYEFQACDLSGNPIAAIQQFDASQIPEIAKQQWLARPFADTYKIRARVGNLIGSSAWAYTSAIPATINGSLSASIDEVPSKSFHHLTANYNINCPPGSSAYLVLKRNGSQIETTTIAAQNGSFTYTNLPDVAGGWNYTIELHGKAPAGSWKILAMISISGGYSGSE